MLQVDGKQLFTNRQKGATYESSFFEQRSNYGNSGYELTVNVRKEGDKTICRSEKLFFRKNITIFDKFQPVGLLTYEDIFDNQHRILKRVSPTEIYDYRYIGPLTEIREKYAIDKKGREKLQERVEVRNTYYK